LPNVDGAGTASTAPAGGLRSAVVAFASGRRAGRPCGAVRIHKVELEEDA
jgi:hypothetical protein